jgi:hypothetical protein
MNTQERKLLCDGDDLYSLHHQLNSLASEFVEKHFKDLYKRSYGNPNYEGQLEKKVVMEEMDKVKIIRDTIVLVIHLSL